MSTMKSGSNIANKKTGRVGRILLALLAVLVIGGGAAWYLGQKDAQANAAAQAGSTTRSVTVERGDIRLTASGSGTLVTNQAVNMSFSTSGKVAELNVKLGDMVKTGDVLARLEKAEDLEANLASAQANLLEAQQALTKLQKGAGASLAKAYQAMIKAQGNYDDALSESQRVEDARCNVEVRNKYQAVLKQATEKLHALLELDPSSQATIIAGYDYDTALANYTYCAAYTPMEKTSAQSTLAVAKAALQEAQNTYETLKEAAGVDPDALSMQETRVTTAQTQVDTAQEALDGITLKAPMDGKITTLAASAGAIVDTSTFLTISDVSHPTVTISLDETDMDKLVVGNPAVVTFTALPGKSFTGKVSLANPQMNSFGPFRAATGQITLDSQAASTFETLPLGLSATITITGKEAQNALLVPVAALKQLNGGEIVVKRVGSDGQLTQQTVTVGIQDDTNAEITSGLNEGDIVSYTTKNSASSNEQGGRLFLDGGGSLPPP